MAGMKNTLHIVNANSTLLLPLAVIISISKIL